MSPRAAGKLTQRAYAMEPWLPAIGLVGLTVFVYARALLNGFVWDDFAVLVENPAVRSLSNLPRFFTDYRTGIANDGIAYYRPLRTVLHAVLYQVAGPSPAAYHALNVALHAGNAVLVYVLCGIWSGSRAVAWLAAAVFALHPIQTEAVTNVTGLTDVLFVTFGLAALIAHHRLVATSRFQGDRILAVYGCFAAALLAKEMAITLPFLVVLSDDWLLDRTGRQRIPGSRFRYAAYLLGFAVLATGFVVARGLLLRGVAAGEWEGVTFTRTMLMQATVLEKYVQLLLVPIGQSVRHVVEIPEPDLAPHVLRALFVNAAIIVAALYHVRRNPHVTFGIAWFYITLLPVMNVIPLPGSMMGERFLYLPMLGFSYALIQLSRPWWHRLAARVGPVRAAAVPALALATLAVLTVRRNLEWKDDVTIFESAVRVSPGSNALRVALITEYERLGMPERRDLHIRAGAENTRRYVEQYLRLGHRARESGARAEAVSWYRRVLGLDPDNATALRALDGL